MTPDTPTNQSRDFEQILNGMLFSLLTWQQLEAFWNTIDRSAGWYIYAVGENLPAKPSSAEEADIFLRQIDELLHREHDEEYCGIVYTDDLEHPSLIKVYDPNHLGASCGSSKQKVLPGWIMSTMPPVEIGIPAVVPANRKRWWQAFLSKASG